VARDLVNRNRMRHGLFFSHLALEGVLKAHVCRATQDIAPRLHNLVRLTELAELSIQPARMDILTAKSNSRIEPIPCGERQWEEDSSSAIVEIARREGETVSLR